MSSFMAPSCKMRLTRDRIAHNYRRAKRFAGQAWNTTERVLSVADRAAGLAVKGMTHLGHRVEPEHRVKIGKGLVKYFETRQKWKASRTLCRRSVAPCKTTDSIISINKYAFQQV